MMKIEWNYSDPLPAKFEAPGLGSQALQLTEAGNALVMPMFVPLPPELIGLFETALDAEAPAPSFEVDVSRLGFAMQGGASTAPQRQTSIEGNLRIETTTLDRPDGTFVYKERAYDLTTNMLVEFRFLESTPEGVTRVVEGSVVGFTNVHWTETHYLDTPEEGEVEIYNDSGVSTLQNPNGPGGKQRSQDWQPKSDDGTQRDADGNQDGKGQARGSGHDTSGRTDKDTKGDTSSKTDSTDTDTKDTEKPETPPEKDGIDPPEKEVVTSGGENPGDPLIIPGSAEAQERARLENPNAGEDYDPLAEFMADYFPERTWQEELSLDQQKVTNPGLAMTALADDFAFVDPDATPGGGAGSDPGDPGDLGPDLPGGFGLAFDAGVAPGLTHGLAMGVVGDGPVDTADPEGDLIGGPIADDVLI